MLLGGQRAEKPSTLVEPAAALELVGPGRRFVSRGGDKLDAALTRFAVPVPERLCLDAGASTGGFTDCLLRRGAGHVVAIDVGYGQLAWSLRGDERVTVMERTNVRELTPALLPYAPGLVVADLSFISLRLVLPALGGVVEPRADLVLLVKPQFEACRTEVGRGGVVRDPEIWRRAISGVVDAARELELGVRDVMASPAPGPAGNVEFLLHLTAGNEVRPDGHAWPDLLEAAIAEGHRVGGSR